MKRKRRRRRVVGMLPRLGSAIGRGVLRVVTHPQWWIAGVLAIAGSAWAWQALTRSPAFQVETVLVAPHSTLKVPGHVVGQNLWTLNVRALAMELHHQQPELKAVRVVRILPSALRVDVTERMPVAQVRTARAKGAGAWYAVDGDGYVFAEMHPMPLERLAIIQGAENPRDPHASIKPGQVSSNGRLLAALRVAERLRRAPALTGRRLAMIDVGDPAQLTFQIDEEVEIRCGSEEELLPQLERLRIALQLVARQKLMVRYIDVRFADPVIGPRT